MHRIEKFVTHSKISAFKRLKSFKENEIFFNCAATRERQTLADGLSHATVDAWLIMIAIDAYWERARNAEQLWELSHYLFLSGECPYPVHHIFHCRLSSKYTLQHLQQYDGHGIGAVYGHIRSAINVPMEEVYNWEKHIWYDIRSLKSIFEEKKLYSDRPVIVYSTTAIHSSLAWFSLKKSNYNASIYLGSWPEWLIRAPEFLKIMPKKKLWYIIFVITLIYCKSGFIL